MTAPPDMDTTLDGLLVPADPDEAVQALIRKFGIHSVICTVEHELQARKNRKRYVQSDHIRPIDHIYRDIPYLTKEDREDLIDALQFLNGTLGAEP